MIGRLCYLLSWNIRAILTAAVPKRILFLRPWSEAKCSAWCAVEQGERKVATETQQGEFMSMDYLMTMIIVIISPHNSYNSAHASNMRRVSGVGR